MHPVLIDLGRFQLPTYGAMLILGVALGLWTLKLRAERAELPADKILDLSLWVVIWALLGAKALLVLVELPRYLRNPAELLGVFRAGGVFLGGLLAAIAAAIVLFRRYRLAFLKTADVVAPSIPLGQAIGRIGCLMAGCCWGGHCDLPWAITYTDPRAHANVGTPLGVPLHPFPVYAMIFNFTLYAFLAWLYRRSVATGRVFASYLMIYGTGRFALEFTRGDAERGFLFHGLLSTSQFIGLLLVATGAVIFHRAGRRQEG